MEQASAGKKRTLFWVGSDGSMSYYLTSVVTNIRCQMDLRVSNMKEDFLRISQKIQVTSTIKKKTNDTNQLMTLFAEFSSGFSGVQLHSASLARDGRNHQSEMGRFQHSAKQSEPWNICVQRLWTRSEHHKLWFLDCIPFWKAGKSHCAAGKIDFICDGHFFVWCLLKTVKTI